MERPRPRPCPTGLRRERQGELLGPGTRTAQPSITSITRRTRSAIPKDASCAVAQSDRIDGPYVDSGAKLTAKPSIDGHPNFVEPEGGCLFYCGNEGNPDVGQLLVDRFVSPTRLENNPRRVFPDEKVAWEEGPFVIRRSGAFYLFSSMGNWRDGSYHVRVARASTILGPWQRLMQDGKPYVLLRSAPRQSGRVTIQCSRARMAGGGSATMPGTKSVRAAIRGLLR